MYDSSLRRFYGVVPLHQTASPYCYVGNNPVNFVDSVGEGSTLTAILSNPRVGALSGVVICIIGVYATGISASVGIVIIVGGASVAESKY